MNILPCSDEITEHAHDTIALHDHEAHGENGHQHHSEEKQTEDCAPFCSCNCCSISIITPDINIYEVSKTDQTFSYCFHYSINYDYSFSEGIWHPPTLI